MKSKEEYDALLHKIMSALKWDEPNDNPYYLWLESRRDDPSLQMELTFAHFVKDEIMKFYSS